MQARVKHEIQWKVQAVNCGSPEPYTCDWRDVPPGDEDRVREHPLLEVRGDTKPAPRGKKGGTK